jgi:hypothetical protein
MQPDDVKAEDPTTDDDAATDEVTPDAAVEAPKADPAPVTPTL